MHIRDFAKEAILAAFWGLSHIQHEKTYDKEPGEKKQKNGRERIM